MLKFNNFYLYIVKAEHIGGTTYFYQATPEEMAQLAASSGGNGSSSNSNGGGGAGSLSSNNLSSSNGGNVTSARGSLGSIASQGTMLSYPRFSVAPPLPAHLHHMRHPTNAPNFFIDDTIKRQLLERQTLAMSQLPPDQFPGVCGAIELLNISFDALTFMKSRINGFATQVHNLLFYLRIIVKICSFEVLEN